MRNTHPHYEVEAEPLSLSLSPSPKSFKVSLLLHRPDPTNFFLGRLAHSFLLSSSSLLVWRRAHRIMTRRDGAEVSREGEGGSSRERYNIDFESGSGNNCDCKSGLPGPRQQQAGSPLPNSTLLHPFEDTMRCCGGHSAPVAALHIARQSDQSNGEIHLPLLF